MKQKLVHSMILALSIMVVSVTAVAAEELVPATTEDLRAFDREIGRVRESDKKEKKDNFGQTVSAEAKRLKTEDKGKDFGQWVSGQRRKNEMGRPDQTGAGGRDMNPQARPDHSPAGSGNGRGSSERGNGRR